MDAFCFEVVPGEGRLATCLKDQLAEESKANYDGAKMTDGCRKALDTFFIGRATNINADLPLAKACVKVHFLFCFHCFTCTSVLRASNIISSLFCSSCPEVVTVFIGLGETLQQDGQRPDGAGLPAGEQEKADAQVQVRDL